MEFRLLGGVTACLDGRPVDLGPARQRCVLAVLLVEANTAVSTDLLIDRVWADRPPSRVLSSLRSYLTRLRRVLADAPVRITIRSGTYVLEVDELTVDLHRFRRLLSQARDADDEQALVLGEQALGLWRGEAFAGLDTPWLRGVRTALEHERFAATLEHVDVALRCGRHATLLPVLATLVEEHPLDERLAGQFMLALYRSGRQADALQYFQRTRWRLADELGADPSPVLRNLHQRILTAAEDLAPPDRRSPVPRQLPAAPRLFVGRERELDELSLEQSTAVAIEGTAGVGKTALAVYFGHKVAPLFPDGQLYLDLRGHADGEPMSHAEALGFLLRSLGVTPRRTDVPELAARYRSALAGKKVLVVLDNARDVGHVRPLLPGAAGCLVVITSRSSFAGMLDARTFRLETLSEDGALALVGAFAGPERIATEPAASVALTSLCARLPLALSIVGARLVARSAWPIHEFVRRLSDERRRLAELRTADLAVLASFELSYHTLRATDPLAADMFRLLGAVDWVDVTVPVAATLLDESQAVAESALERLLDDHLLESATPGRYRAHDLLRLYARDLSLSDLPERQAALVRVLTCYAATAERAAQLMHLTTSRWSEVPMSDQHLGFPLSTLDDAIGWCETEYGNLLAIVHQAAAADREAQSLMVRLTAALYLPIEFRGRRQDHVVLRSLAASAARGLGDRPGEALANEDLGWGYIQIGRLDDAVTSFQRALAIHREDGDHAREPKCMAFLGYAYRQLHRYDDATACHEQGLLRSREAGDRRSEAGHLDGLGAVCQQLNRLDDAIAYHQRALAISQHTDDSFSQVIALNNLGLAQSANGNCADAIDLFEQSVTISREFGFAHKQAQALWGLAQTHHMLGQHDKAMTHWRRSITILRDTGELTAERAAALCVEAVPQTPDVIRRNR